MNQADAVQGPRVMIDAALSAANVMMRVAARSVLEVEDVVTTPQLRVLMLIAMNGPQSLGPVAAELGVHASNATRTCEKLVQAGLIARSDDPADRRFIQLDLTTDGASLVDQVLRRRREAMADVYAAMSPGEQSAVTAALEIFARAAGDEPSRDGRFTFTLET